jgi:phosphoglycolate phosphatase-like HAD superfamily hydrolase
MYVPPMTPDSAEKSAGNPQDRLRAYRPGREFFVGIDSDGCAFNSMEVKHNDGFSPNVVKHFGLQALSRQVHQVWDFVSLYSQTRGCNRFRALVAVFDELRSMPRVKESGVPIPELPYLRRWIESETLLGNPRLEAKLAAAHGAEKEELAPVLAWSRAVNRSIEEIVRGLPPFRGVRESLARLRERADLLVVSATPQDALDREWAEHGIDRYVSLIAGQEMGSKVEHLRLAAEGKFPPDKILMVGDAPGDLEAARQVKALFYPINPGDEEASWDRFLKEGIDRFFSRRYAGAYEAERIAEFDRLLPRHPPWKTA